MSVKEKWSTLQHNGPYFPPEHIVRGWTIKINEKDITFVNNPLADEMTYHWAAKLETKYVTDRTFQKNFWIDYEPVIRQLHDLPEKLRFPQDFDFTDYHSKIMKEREDKKNRSKDEKRREKDEREARKSYYGRATLDNVEVELGNYSIEPAGIFMGRGEHPLRGRWKPRVHAEDVTLNLSSESPTPPCNGGGSWKGRVENRNALWTAMWYEKLTGAQKRVLFSANSFVRQGNDIKKFDKARSLAENYSKVVEFIDKKLTSLDRATRELATVCKLIQVLSIRVGDEKGEDTADTVGASSLRVEHATINGTTLILDFLGKDSIPYHSETEFDINVVRNLHEFMEGKKPEDEIFPKVNSREIKDFLSIVVPGLTAKNFRTATGSALLAKQLKNQIIDPNIKDSKKIEYFTEANLDVAIQLNHQSAVSEAYERSLQNMKDKLKDIKKELREVKKEMKSELERAKETRDLRVETAKRRYTGSRRKESIERAKRSYDNKRERYEKKIRRLDERIENYESKIRIKEKTKGIALGTSKLNYADPRIPISWAKANNVDLKRIYPPTAQKKFEWALDTDEDFYKKYPEI